jgi:NADH dehydrogenase
LNPLPHVVIIGAGFGGLEAAKRLHEAPVKVTLIDRTNHHLFQPLLYQVAMASISSTEIAYPIRSIFREQPNVTVLMADVTGIDLKKQTISMGVNELKYDYLIIAAGSQNSYFGHAEWTKHAIGLKTLQDAFMIRRQILLAFETAEKLAPAYSVENLLTFVIIGGGPTGVELAGSLAELSRHALSKDFRNIKPSSAKIILLEGAPRILPPFPEEVSRLAEEKLRALGVEVLTRTFVTDINEHGVQIGEKFIPAVTKLWCAGVAPSPLSRALADVQLDKGGRIIVQPDLSIENYPNVFAVGDICSYIQDGKPLPGLAPVAMQQGQFVGETIENRITGRELKQFRYIDRGTLATIGRSSAVGNVGNTIFSGLPAWLAWLFIHVMNLIGFRNRMVVMLDWVWSYVTFQRGARLISDRGAERDIDVDRYILEAFSKPEPAETSTPSQTKQIPEAVAASDVKKDV